MSEVLNRQERRLLNKKLKSASYGSKDSENSGLDERMVGVIEKVLSSEDNPFELDKYSFDLRDLAPYILTTCGDKELIKSVYDKFYDANDIDELASIKECRELNDERISLAYTLKDKADEYLRLCRICDIDRNACMYLCLLVVANIGHSYFTTLLGSSCKNSLAGVLETYNYAKNVKVVHRLNILMMVINLYWNNAVSLLNKKLVKTTMKIEVGDSLVQMINDIVPEGNCYVDWVKGNKTLQEVMLECGDMASEPTEEFKGYAQAIFENSKSYIIESFVTSGNYKDLKNNFEKLSKKSEDQAEKIEELKKDKKAIQSELKAITKEKSSSDKNCEKLQKEVDKLKTAYDKLEESSKVKVSEQQVKDAAEAKKYKEDLTEAEEKIKALEKELEDNKNSSSEKEKDLQYTIKALSKKLNTMNNMYEDIQKYLLSLNDTSEYKDVPLEMIMNDIKDVKLLVCGGEKGLDTRLKQAGFNVVKQSVVGTADKVGAIGEYDCLVIIASYVTHKTVMGVTNHARQNYKKIVYCAGTNIEAMCREVYKVYNQ